MDNTAQKSQNEKPAQQTSVSSGVNPPISSVSGGPGKEAEKPISSFISHSERPPIIEKEVANVGVEAVSEKPEITKEHEQVGIKPSLENNIPELEPSGKVKLPLTKDEAEKIVAKDKGQITKDFGEHQEGNYFMPSALGLAMLVLKHIKKIKDIVKI